MNREPGAAINNYKDMAGQRFGMLTVLRYEPTHIVGAHWWCQCDCGKQKTISGKNLRKGQYSCGCVSIGRRTHNLSGSKTYQSWVDMRRRCADPTRPAYKDYGGRGISVCDRWSKFTNFLADMGEMPDGHSIERVDNNLGYSRGNCCWIPKEDQSKNRRCVRQIDVNGDTMSVAAAARHVGIKNTTLFYRLNAGWPADRILEDVR